MRTTTTLLALVLTGSLVVPTTAADPLIEYVDNGGFEEFDANGPIGWMTLGGAVSEVFEAFEGDMAVGLSATGDVLQAGISQTVSLEDDDLPTLSGTEYEFSFAADLNTGSATPVNDPPTAEAVVLWKDPFGEVVGMDHVPIMVSQGYETYEVMLMSPLPEPGELPVTEAEVQFSMTRASLESRADSELFVDAVSFGPVLPSL